MLRKIFRALQFVKLGKKRVKQILINLFGLLENEYIYIYIYILGGFPVVGKKKNEWKKEKQNLIRSSWMGYCPFSVLSHDTVVCIVTQAHKGAIVRAATRPG